MANNSPKYPKKYFESDSSGSSKTIGNQSNFIKAFSDDDNLHIAKSFDFIQIKKICDKDDRFRIDAKLQPFNTICRLVIKTKEGEELVGTGFFISPKVILTSGHCVFRKGNWVGTVLVIPGDNGIHDRRPFGSQVSKVFKSVKGWTENKERDFDYGAIILPDNTLFTNLGSPKLFEPKIISTKSPLLNSGYTANEKKFEQWACKGDLKKFTTYRVYYNNDTESGNSGSPILFENQGNFEVVGIHSYGECPNFCIRINRKILNLLNQWKSI